MANLSTKSLPRKKEENYSFTIDLFSYNYVTLLKVETDFKQAFFY